MQLIHFSEIISQKVALSLPLGKVPQARRKLVFPEVTAQCTFTEWLHYQK